MSNKILHHIKSFDADHSKVSPSSSHRWLHCPGSINIQEKLGVAGTSSAAAAEGTAAHWICEQHLKVKDRHIDHLYDTYLGQTIAVTNTDVKGEEHHYEFVFDKVLLDYCAEYIEYCQELSLGVEFQSVEAKVPLTGILGPEDEERHGWVDFLMVEDGVLTCVDLKFGKSVFVPVEDNPQLMLYALGAYMQFRTFFELKQVKIVVHQPRMGNVGEQIIPIKDLLTWADEHVKPAIKLIDSGSTDVCVGLEGQCKWCPVKSDCKAHFEALSIDMFGPVPDEVDEGHLAFRCKTVLTESEKVAIFLKRMAIVNWVNSLGTQLLHDSIELQEPPEGLKIVSGKGSRAWTDIDKADKAVARLGIPVAERRTTPVLLSAPKIEKIIGKNHAIMRRHVTHFAGKPTLVSADDKRPPYEFEDASKDFDNL